MPDNDARRQAEEQIRRQARDPQVVLALVHHLRTAKTPNVRQLAAVLIRQKITSHWPKLPPHAKASLKQALIDSITVDHRYYGDILHGLHPLFATSEPYHAVTDNAAGVIARMIMVQPQSIPLNQVLPVFIKALPLKEDYEESMGFASITYSKEERWSITPILFMSQT